MQRSIAGVVERFESFKWVLSCIKLLKYHRSVEYCINGHHNGHLPVKANCTQLSLSLSSTTLTLTEPYLASNTAGESCHIHYIAYQSPDKCIIMIQQDWGVPLLLLTSTMLMFHSNGMQERKWIQICSTCCIQLVSDNWDMWLRERATLEILYMYEWKVFKGNKNVLWLSLW